MAGSTTPPLTQPTTGHTGHGAGAPTDPDTDSAHHAAVCRTSISDDPAFVAFFLEYCQGRFDEVPYGI
jgi:hypothetical protein